MTIRILHTADLHLGMKFAHGYPPAVQNELVKARYETLGRLVTIANEEQCQVFLIVGDLFDSQQVSAKDVHSAAEMLDQFEGSLVVILPGNHDYMQPSSDLWTEFQTKAGPSVLLMDKAMPYDLRQYGLNLALYPAPCTSRLSSENAIGWIRTCGKLPGIAFHIGVAHGSINGISPDFKKEYYPMTQEEIQSFGLDLWLMGHTHVRYPDVDEGSDKRILFPATPEPDGLDRVHAGYVSIIDIEDEKSFKYRSIETGKHRFFDLDVELSSERDIDALGADLNRIGSNSAIVRLRLNGHLPIEAIEKLDTLKSVLEKSLFFLKFDSSGVQQAVTGKDIDREFTVDSFPHRLLKTLISRGANPLVVRWSPRTGQVVKVEFCS